MTGRSKGNFEGLKETLIVKHKIEEVKDIYTKIIQVIKSEVKFVV